MAKDNNLTAIYKILENKIMNSSEYNKFLHDVITKETLGIKTDKIEDFEQLLDFNLDDLSDVFNNENSPWYEERFHKFITDATKDEDIMQTIINNGIIETKYGNPERRKINDYTLNDMMFKILQGVFSSEVLLLSVSDKNALKYRFDVIKEDEMNFDDFKQLIEKIYVDSKGLNDIERVKDVLKANVGELKPYIAVGIQKQINEISNSKNGNFKEFDELYKALINDVLEIDKAKTM